MQKQAKDSSVKEGKEIQELNPETFEYEPVKKLKTPSIEMAKQQKGLANKVKTLSHTQKTVQVKSYGTSLQPTLLYSAELHGEIADDIVAIDKR